MAQLYTNENFPRQVAEILRNHGHEVLTVQDSERAGQGISDEDILAFAVSSSRIVITLNRRDFIRLHLVSNEHMGIIVCTQDADFNGQAERINQVLTSDNDLRGQLVRINRPQE